MSRCSYGDCGKRCLHNACVTLGERIREARQNARLTQEQLAHLCGVRRASVSQWESERSHPSRKNLLQIARVTSTSTDWLLAEGAEPSRVADSAPRIYAADPALVALWEALPSTAQSHLLELLRDLLPREPAKSPAVDTSILAEAIQAIDEVSENQGIELTPARRARLAATLYERWTGGESLEKEADSILSLVAGR